MQAARALLEPRPGVSRTALWIGRGLSWIVAFTLLSSGLHTFNRSPQVLQGLFHLGYQPSILVPIAVLEVVCTVLYLAPPTSVLGAILLTGYLGGAVASHLRIGDPQWPVALVLGAVVWLSVYLRDPAVRTLLPLRH